MMMKKPAPMSPILPTPAQLQDSRLPKADPATPEFWNSRFEAAATPWDQGGVPQCLEQYLKQSPDGRAVARAHADSARPSVLIPGCGSAHEVRMFADLGWEVSAIDFSSAAVAQAKRVLGAHTSLAGMVRVADFFSAALGKEQFDLVYERAFLCALPRRLWPDWAQQIARVIPVGGRLTGFFFIDETEKGPPFGLGAGELEAMLTPHFTRLQLLDPIDSVAVFAGKETWQVWVRN